jgi:hypothetical protein
VSADIHTVFREYRPICQAEKFPARAEVGRVIMSAARMVRSCPDGRVRRVVNVVRAQTPQPLRAGIRDGCLRPSKRTTRSPQPIVPDAETGRAADSDYEDGEADRAHRRRSQVVRYPGHGGPVHRCGDVAELPACFPRRMPHLSEALIGGAKRADRGPVRAANTPPMATECARAMFSRSKPYKKLAIAH